MMHATIPQARPSTAIVVGAGLGGLAAAMRLGAKGYAVTVPQVFRELWASCGRDFDADVDLRPLDPFYEIRWPDGSHFTARGSTDAMVEEVRRLSPGDVDGYLRFLKDAYRRYVVGFEGMVAKPMHRLWSTAKVLPEFARLRADRSILGLARARVKDERLRMARSEEH